MYTKQASRIPDRFRHHDYDTILLEFPLEIYFQNYLVFIVFKFIFVVSATKMKDL